MSDAMFGSGVLLRFAALPLAAHEQGGSPALFDELYRLEADSGQYRRLATELAEDLGRVLIPRPGLSRSERAQVLTLRRALHQGLEVPDGLLDQVSTIIAREAADTDLVIRSKDLARRAAGLRNAAHAVARAVESEHHRQLGLPWQVLQEHPAGRRALAGGDVTIYADIAERLDAGQPWTTKRMRQRSDYLWRMLTRASARATPRGWLAHVAALTVAEHGWSAGQPITIDSQAAAETVDNIDDVRGRSDDLVTDCPDSVVTVSQSPLAWCGGRELAVWVVQGQARTTLTRVTLRRTPLLDTAWHLLADGPRPVDMLVSQLAGGKAAQAPTIRHFLAHLVSVGALQAARPLKVTQSGWHELSALPGPAAAATATGRYTDVYRRSTSPIADAHAADLAEAVGLALRVMACVDRSSPPAGMDLPEAVTERPRPLLDAVADCVNADSGFAARTRGQDWAQPTPGDTGYRRLYEWLTEQLPADPRQACEPVDLDAAWLDRWGLADDVGVDWPVDALLRPIAAGGDGPVASLVALSPAGVLDARFLPALDALGESPLQVVGYRRFLEQLTGLTGVPFVEVLIPPLSRLAANAVRRPLYTSWWTGDPDPTGYFHPELPGPTRHLPLAGITIRRAGRGVITAFDGAPIWPLIHTARVAPPPWDVVRTLLTLGSPQFGRHPWRSLENSLPAWPSRGCLPRITVGGRLVLTPAQWRVCRNDFGRRDDRLIDRARALASLRRTRGLPRWVTISADANRDPVALDLDSLQALRVIDRIPDKHQRLAISELIPGPAELSVRDLADPATGGHYAELLLRLPYRTTPDAAADALASRLITSARAP